VSRYILIRRLYGPAFLLLVGVNALLAQAHILNWGQSWPFYLILLGVLKLAERAALASEGYPQVQPNGWSQQPPPMYPGVPQPPVPSAQPTAQPISAIVPSIAFEIVKDPQGGNQ